MNLGNRLGLVALLLMFALSGCGGDDAFVGGGGGGGGGGVGPGTPAVPVAAGIVLLVNPPVLQSSAVNDADGVTITAIALNANNVVMPDVPLSFMTDSGTLAVADSVTNANGRATAVLTTAGDSRNRLITVTVSSGAVSETITVNVVGTVLSVVGPQSIESGETETYTVTLADSASQGIRDVTVNAASSQGNVFSPTSAVTNFNGRAAFGFTGNVGGQDTLTFTGADMSVQRLVQVSRDGIVFSAPTAGTEVSLGTTTTVTAQLRRDGNPLAGAQMSFSTSRGALSATNVTTDANGSASVTLTATGASGAGPVLVTAMGPAPDHVTRKHSFEFVATTPASINVQAGPATVAPGEQAAVTAIVRDSNGNPVKNQVVRFTLNDTSGGTLTATTGVTNIQGAVSTTYNASSASSAQNGVVITAAVGDPLIASDEARLTVAAPAVFIVLGTDNRIVKNDGTATYEKTFTAILSDAAGNPAPPDTQFQLAIRSHRYRKGQMVLPAAPSTDPWTANITVTCDTEDPQGTGNINLVVDTNNNGQIDPPNVATVPGTATIDANGVASFVVRWPQSYAVWVIARLTATATVAGTESTRTMDFALSLAQADVARTQVPPNEISPFGTSASCADAT